MATVHTAYGPGEIVDRETVRGRTQYKVAGDGFEVWLDEAKLGGYTPGDLDMDAPHWQGHDLGDKLTGDAFGGDYGPLSEDEVGEYADPRGQLDRDRMRTHEDYDGYGGEDDSRYYARRRVGGLREESGEDRPRGWFADEEPAGAPRLTADELLDGADWDDDPYGYHNNRPTPGRSHLYRDFDARRRQAWAPMDHDNSTELPYNPSPQHDAVGFSGDDGSATLQPVHHIDADERLHDADSLSFDDEGDGDEPGPSAELFARNANFHPGVIPEQVRKVIRTRFPVTDKLMTGLGGHVEGQAVGHALNMAGNQVDQIVDMAGPGPGWGDLIKGGSRHEANPALLLPLLGIGAEEGLGAAAAGAAARAAGGAALHKGLDAAGDAIGDFGPGSSEEGWGDLVKDSSYRPAGLSDRYIDITAGADYHNDPVAQFRHDPDAYINRIGHLMDEGLNPRFAEYMDLVEADGSVRTAAWKDVRAKAMRLKTSGKVHVKDLAPSRIMASVDGDHGTYDVVILKGASYGDQSIANWHCGCEWGKWAFRRKFSYVGRLCSHAYASYLTMQSAALKSQPRTKRSPSDMVIKRRNPRDRQYPMPVFAAGLKTADALQDGPKRLTPELAINDTDDAHMFLDVTKDERKDVGPDDVVSEKDIVHFARLMRHYEVTQQPYPRQLVAFLARYAEVADDRPSDFRAPDTEDADPALNRLRDYADRPQSEDFGDMADRVRRIQDAVEDARDHGVDASQFVARLFTADDKPKYQQTQDGGRTIYRGPDNKGYAYENGKYTPVNFTGQGSQGPEGNRYEMGQGGYTKSTENGRDLYRYDGGQGNSGFAVQNGDVRGVQYNGKGEQGENGKQRFDYNGDADQSLGDFKNFLQSGPGAPKTPQPNPGGGLNNNNGGGSANNNNGGGSANNGGGGGSANNGGGGGGGGSANNGGGGGGSKGGGTGGGYTAPGGGMTSGNVADGGVAGAENGNNSSIGKDQLDADGYYTVQKGDTLTDIAQRAYGDMNKYQDLAKGNSIANPDVINEGQRIKIDNPTGNGGLSGDKTNPAGGGSDNNIATPETKAPATPSTPAVDTSAVSTPQTPAAATPGDTSNSGGTGSGNIENTMLPQQGGGSQSITDPGLTNPPAPAGDSSTSMQKPAALRTAKDWLRWAAPNATNPANPADPNQGQNGQTSTTAPSSTTAKPSTPASPGAAPASNPATTAQPGGSSSGTGSRTQNEVKPNPSTDTFDPNDPAQTQAPQQQGTGSPANTGGSGQNPASGMGMGLGGGSGSGNGFDMGQIGDMIGQGVGMASDLASPILDGIGSGIGNAVSGIASGLGSIFASREDFDDWARYAYPTADGEGKLEPHTHPFAGSGYPGPLEFDSSEDYADEARKKMDDVTDLGSGDLTKPMKEWQKQSAVEDDFDPYREASIGYSTDDDSDIVRTFQAHLGETALGGGAGQGSGRFDDFAGAAQGFLRTAGRNYSLAEQSELIREGDKGGARNLDSLQLEGTHYEDMHTLGW